jgi:hypothetical protein
LIDLKCAFKMTAKYHFCITCDEVGVFGYFDWEVHDVIVFKSYLEFKLEQVVSIFTTSLNVKSTV